MKRFMRPASLLVAVFLFAQAWAFGYPPDDLSQAEQAEWKAMSGREAGKRLLELRKADEPDLFAACFLLFLDQGRSPGEILALLRTTGLPLLTPEVESIGSILAEEVPESVRFRNAIEHGYSIECHATPGTRISLVFLNEDERKVFKKKFAEDKALSPEEDEIYGNLEGRLCVWATRRKIHLGGPHFTFERVVRILTHRSRHD